MGVNWISQLRGTRGVTRLLVVALAALVAGASPTPAVAQAPASWTALLPPAPAGSDPSQAAECPGGEPECVDQVAAALETHVAELGCSHNAVFPLAYQRITERIAAAVRDPGFFARPRYIARFDAAFAAEYGRQWDAWAHGSGTPAPAWRTSFEVAAARAARGSANLLLALNAHIARDMPLVLERVGLVDADGGSYKPDQDRVNTVLRAAMRPMLTELADRYDPTIDDGDVPTEDDDAAVYQWVAAMRERAWRLAEQLDAADENPVAKAALVVRIEREAQVAATAIAAASAYPPGSSEADARDAYCAAQTNGG